MNGRDGLQFGFVIALTFAVFSPLLRADFTAWDDPDTLAQNPKLHPPTRGNLVDYWTTAGEAAPMGLYVPVTYTVWSAASIPNGPRPAVIHGINISLHAVTAGLVFLLLRRFASPFPAMIGSAVFALHPVQVEAVGWASGTKDLLCGLFCVATLLIETTPGRSRWLRTLAFASFVLGMLSKPTAMVVAIMLVAHDLYQCGTGTLPVFGALRRSLIRRLPWLVAATLCAIVTSLSQQVPWQTTLPIWTRPIVAADAITFYLGKIVFPVRLCIDHGRTPQFLFASSAVYWTWIIPAALAVLLCVGRPLRAAVRPAGSGRPTFRLAAAWFVMPLMPLLGLIPFDFQYFSTVADHYLYLPMVGIAIAIAVALPRRPGGKIIAMSTLVLISFSILTIRQEQTWMNTKTLASQAIAANPRTFVGHDLVGYDEFVTARRDQSPAHFAAAIDQYEQALANNPTYVTSLTNLAMAQHQSGRPVEALATLRRLVELQPSLPPALRADPNALSDQLARYGDPAGAAPLLARPHGR